MTLKIGPEGILESQIIVESKDPQWDENHELIERKGIGHPDTIADKLANNISREYSKYTYLHCDKQVLHHQIAKLMVIGGKTEVTWGHGRFIEPIRIIVAGRISEIYLGKKIPVDAIIKKTIKDFFADLFPLIAFEKDVIIENKLTTYPGPGTIKESKGSIANMFGPVNKGEIRGYERLVANDTSFCVYYSPLSKFEQAIIEVEKQLNDKKTKEKFPWLGTDIKIMGVRNESTHDITLCIPQIAKYVKSIDQYKNNLNTLGVFIENEFKSLLQSDNVQISINTKDDYEKNNVYLTVSGSSLSGDIGVVGRGNRINGLITSCRPMSLEGTNGKNPRYYSGFIYAILSKIISERIFSETGRKNTVEIVSQNGGPLLRPWRINVICNHPAESIKKLVLEECDKIESITQDFMKGKFENLS